MKLSKLIEAVEKKIGKKIILSESLKIGNVTLEKNKEYNWTMGAGFLDIIYIGKTSENKDIKVGSKVGHGYIFKWKDDNR